MKSILEFDKDRAKALKYLLCDIDDTITTDGKLTAEAYTALWKLSDAGIDVIPVTGRPAGWCDMIVRQWPVKAVVGENGAFVYYFEDSQQKTFTHPLVHKDVKEKLERIRQRVLKEIPGTRIAKDQFARIYDLAIDFNEDPPYLGFEVAEQIKDICVEMGAEAKVSSIHVNTWYGKYDKVDMTRLFFKEVLKEDPLKTGIFFGDSPNDEPMFEFFENSCAVANIKPFLAQLNHLPTYVTEEESGLGFAKAVDHILALYNA